MTSTTGDIYTIFSIPKQSQNLICERVRKEAVNIAGPLWSWW